MVRVKLAAVSCKLFSILQTPLNRIFLIASIGRRPAFRIAIPFTNASTIPRTLGSRYFHWTTFDVSHAIATIYEGSHDP